MTYINKTGILLTSDLQWAGDLLAVDLTFVSCACAGRGGSTSSWLLDDDDDDEYASDVDHGLTGKGQELESSRTLNC